MKWPVGLFIVILLLLGGVGVYYFFGNDLSSVSEEAAVAGLIATSSPISGRAVTPGDISTNAPPPEGYVEYKNERYGFSFYHSPEATVKEYDEGGGAMTIVLENAQKLRGMQIFIVPYNEPSISEERFRLDVPSGVRTSVEDAALDGVRAVTFVSKDERLGETREVWSIKDGYLYEITTFKGVGNWFIPIIQTWRFL